MPEPTDADRKVAEKIVKDGDWVINDEPNWTRLEKLIAHALASCRAEARAEQREADARVAENWIPDPHKEHEPCQDCATARGICDAIRRGGE